MMLDTWEEYCQWQEGDKKSLDCVKLLLTEAVGGVVVLMKLTALFTESMMKTL